MSSDIPSPAFFLTVPAPASLSYSSVFLIPLKTNMEPYSHCHPPVFGLCSPQWGWCPGQDPLCVSDSHFSLLSDCVVPFTLSPTAVSSLTPTPEREYLNHNSLSSRCSLYPGYSVLTPFLNTSFSPFFFLQSESYPILPSHRVFCVFPTTSSINCHQEEGLYGHSFLLPPLNLSLPHPVPSPPMLKQPASSSIFQVCWRVVHWGYRLNIYCRYALYTKPSQPFRNIFSFASCMKSGVGSKSAVECSCCAGRAVVYSQYNVYKLTESAHMCTHTHEANLINFELGYHIKTRSRIEWIIL